MDLLRGENALPVLVLTERWRPCLVCSTPCATIQCVSQWEHCFYEPVPVYDHLEWKITSFPMHQLLKATVSHRPLFTWFPQSHALTHTLWHTAESSSPSLNSQLVHTDLQCLSKGLKETDNKAGQIWGGRSCGGRSRFKRVWNAADASPLWIIMCVIIFQRQGFMCNGQPSMEY